MRKLDTSDECCLVLPWQGWWSECFYFVVLLAQENKAQGILTRNASPRWDLDFHGVPLEGSAVRGGIGLVVVWI